MTRPITVITGEFSGRRLERLRRLGWGRCFVERPVRPLESEPWIFDNGAFRWFRKGLAFQSETFVLRMTKAAATGARPLFAVIPDVVQGGLESLAFSLGWLDAGQLTAGWDWYLAVQDGMTLEAVEAVIARDDVAGLFIGGSDAFKATAAQWAALAHRHGKGCHFGRASTRQRLAQAIAAGCDSCDSAYILWTDARFVRYARAWRVLTGQLDPAGEAYLEAGAPIPEAA